ncbi:hypothetical protein AB0M86_47610 [Streptomyces sp. NPDC051639]|uniref:hypothetical protein n=1 Tax=Streptomyces sp. NPDC051639 TaxID=3155671 RepID=UPI0034192370
MTEITPEPLHPAELALARLRAGVTAGLTVEQSARIQGTTPEEMTADATTFAAELNAATTTPQTFRSGGNQGPDVGSATGVAAGAAEYERKHPKREPLTVPTDAQSRRNSFQANTYTMNGRW